jgi:proline dehydrogenase
MMDEFALHIVRTHGMETLEELNRLKHTAKKHTRAELQEMIDYYKDLVDHNCSVEGRMMIEKGKECNWCGKEEK